MKSVKEKAEAYDEALGRLEDIKTGKCQKTFVFTEGLFDYLFPELRESEDERMKNGLISHLKELKERAAEGSFLKHPTHYDAWLAWLEKQGEQNLANSAKTCKDEQKPILDVEIPFGAKDSELQEASYSIPNGYHAEIEGNNVIIKKGENKPWSEEDEDILNTIINHFKVDIGCTDEDDMVRWLKSLKDRYTWKPSDEMLEALYRAVPKNVKEMSEDEMLFDKLYQGLKYGRVLSEKQGEQPKKHDVCDNCDQQGSCVSPCPMKLVEKHGKQKPADNVETKFHEGEWLCENEPNNYARFIQILEIVNVQGKERCRISRDIHNDEDIVEFDFVEKYYHKFDIQDAKDGDALYLQKDGKEYIIIYKGVIKERFKAFVSAYCAYNGIVDAFCFADVSRYVDIAYGGIMPATKEQRDTLERAMTNAGYRWNKEELKLEKI